MTEPLINTTIRLRRISDGAEVLAREWYQDRDVALHDWLHGNNSCDCNRASVFGDYDSECSFTAYRIVEMMWNGEFVQEAKETP